MFFYFYLFIVLSSLIIILDGLKKSTPSITKVKTKILILLFFNIILYLFYPISAFATFMLSLALIYNRFSKLINLLPAQNAVTKNIIFKASISNLVMARLDVPREQLTCLEYSESFYIWYKTFINPKAPADLTGLNWYDLFPNLKEEWIEDHYNCVKYKTSLSNSQDYWPAHDAYLHWTIEYIGDNILLFSFEDITPLVKEIKKNETLINAYRAAGKGLLFKLNSEINNG